MKLISLFSLPFMSCSRRVGGKYLGEAGWKVVVGSSQAHWCRDDKDEREKKIGSCSDESATPRSSIDQIYN